MKEDMNLYPQDQALNELEARVRDPRTPMDTMITLAHQAIRLARLIISTTRAYDLQDTLARLTKNQDTDERPRYGIRDAYRFISAPTKEYRPWDKIFKKWR
jgi:hypothetical protein